MDLLVASFRQVIVVLLAALTTVLLVEHGVIGPAGWRTACIMLLALGVFGLRIAAEIVWVSFRHDPEAGEDQAA